MKKTSATSGTWTWFGFKESDVEQKNNQLNMPGDGNNDERENKSFVLSPQN